ncbi:DUF4097 family beta strand repeat-containing protein [Lactobacillus sp. Sy-1]|uniref:DUF4097 family beta strand repeat-containing protein n=1 Tax=Lactobacillus sp. Sy-1 TaxID=2109645 RepID=UPI001C5B8D0C|nr:DUF4097 family beta strand repeat-containing protein [Lactobacillus sp. Sy-1]MBW1606268.1 DUF4097 family beta strand repeat protein [Lactobacillus sp. Sy-1]
MKKVTILGLSSLIIGVIIATISFSMVGFNPNKMLLEFRKIQSDEYGPSYSKKLSSFDRIKIKSNAAVVVKYGDEYKVTAKNSKGSQNNYYVKNGELIVSSKHHARNSFNLIGLGTAMYTTKITITIPKGVSLTNYYQDSTSLIMNGIKVNNALRLSGNGSVNLTNVNAGSLHVDSDYGDIKVKHSSFKVHPSELDTSDGRIMIENNHFSSLGVNNENGNITLNNNIIDYSTGEITNENGQINLGSNTWNTLKVKNDNGDILFTHQLINRGFTAESENGNIIGKASKSDNARIVGKTSNGKVTIDQDIQSFNGNKIYSFKNDNGDISIANG